MGQAKDADPGRLMEVSQPEENKLLGKLDIKRLELKWIISEKGQSNMNQGAENYTKLLWYGSRMKM